MARPISSTLTSELPAPSVVLELLKPITWFPPMWAFACGVVSSGVPAQGRWPMILAGVVLCGPLLCATSQAVNDWFDRINSICDKGSWNEQEIAADDDRGQNTSHLEQCERHRGDARHRIAGAQQGHHRQHRDRGDRYRRQGIGEHRNPAPADEVDSGAGDQRREQQGQGRGARNDRGVHRASGPL